MRSTGISEFQDFPVLAQMIAAFWITSVSPTTEEQVNHNSKCWRRSELLMSKQDRALPAALRFQNGSQP